MKFLLILQVIGYELILGLIFWYINYLVKKAEDRHETKKENILSIISGFFGFVGFFGVILISPLISLYSVRFHQSEKQYEKDHPYDY